MKNSFHVLRTHRRKTQLTQSDVAYLINLKDNSSISRCEKGDRPPTVDIILTYQLLFETHLGELLIAHREKIKNRIASRIKPLIASIEQEPPSDKTIARMEYLKQALKRLNEKGL
jgi:transcriptional regulator with XRE-family HTH domain